MMSASVFVPWRVCNFTVHLLLFDRNPGEQHEMKESEEILNSFLMFMLCVTHLYARLCLLCSISKLSKLSIETTKKLIFFISSMRVSIQLTHIICNTTLLPLRLISQSKFHAMNASRVARVIEINEK